MVKDRFSQGSTVTAVITVDALAAVVAVVADKIVAVSLASSCSSSESIPLLTGCESLRWGSCGLRLNDSDVRSAIPQIPLWAGGFRCAILKVLVCSEKSGE